MVKVSRAVCKAAKEFHAKPLTYEQVRAVRKDHLSPALITFYAKPVLVVKGDMQYLYDDKGKKYLDFFGGIVTVSVGHCHPYVNQALKQQVDKLWHTTSIYMTPPIHEYAEKLTSKFPEPLKMCYLVNSGSEANDLALMMARLYTGRYDVITMRNGYHGCTQTVQGATNLSNWKQPLPAGFGIYKTMNADPYQGPWGGSNCRDSPVQTTRKCDCAAGKCLASDKYSAQFQETLDFDIPQSGLAAFLVESIQGVGGTVQYPKNFLKRAFEKTRARGGVCISDEVQTGFGRLGEKFWGFETHGVTPDIVTLAKGIGNGFPLGAVITTKEIADCMKTALHFNTYGGNPLASTVGSAVLDVIETDRLQRNCEQVGTHLLKKLAEFRGEFEMVGDVRGKGLMIGVELVEDKESKTPLNATKMGQLFEDTKDKGLLLGKGGRYGNVLRIKPPMCITMADADHALCILRDVFRAHK